MGIRTMTLDADGTRIIPVRVENAEKIMEEDGTDYILKGEIRWEVEGKTECYKLDADSETTGEPGEATVEFCPEFLGEPNMLPEARAKFLRDQRESFYSKRPLKDVVDPLDYAVDDAASAGSNASDGSAAASAPKDDASPPPMDYMDAGTVTSIAVFVVVGALFVGGLVYCALMWRRSRT